MVIYVLCFGMSVGTVHHFRPYIYLINTINDCGNTCVKMDLVILGPFAVNTHGPQCLLLPTLVWFCECVLEPILNIPSASPPPSHTAHLDTIKVFYLPTDAQ